MARDPNRRREEIAPTVLTRRSSVWSLWSVSSISSGTRQTRQTERQRDRTKYRFTGYASLVSVAPVSYLQLFMTEGVGGGLPWWKDCRALHLFKRGAGSNKSIVMPDPESLPHSWPIMSLNKVSVKAGQNPSRQNSIGNRLRDHRTGQSGNPGIANYTKSHKVSFTYLGSEVLGSLVKKTIMEIEGLFLEDFLECHGSYPICNNQSGIDSQAFTSREKQFSIDWTFFQ